MEYKVTPDIRTKEKVVGGLFTVSQTIFLVLAGITGGALGVVAFSLFKGKIGLIILGFVIGAIPFLPFAFITIPDLGDMELFRYLVIRVKYSRSQKTFVNMNENRRRALLGPKVEKEENKFLRKIFELFGGI